jgi:hypothetical protein
VGRPFSLTDVFIKPVFGVRYNEGYYYAQKNRVHINRAFGGNCHHCIIDGDIDAGFAAGKKTGKIGCL